MDTRLTQAASPVAQTSLRTDAPQARGATKTVLAPPVAVAAQAGAEQTRWTRDQRKAEIGIGMPKRTESSIETDRETGDLVYKIVDPETRATVTQYPYESLLKLRAYIKSVDEAAS